MFPCFSSSARPYNRRIEGSSVYEFLLTPGPGWTATRDAGQGRRGYRPLSWSPDRIAPARCPRRGRCRPPRHGPRSASRDRRDHDIPMAGRCACGRSVDGLTTAVCACIATLKISRAGERGRPWTSRTLCDRRIAVGDAVVVRCAAAPEGSSAPRAPDTRAIGSDEDDLLPCSGCSRAAVPNRRSRRVRVPPCQYQL